MTKLSFISLFGLLFVSTYTFGEYDSKQKEAMGTESSELSQMNENSSSSKSGDNNLNEKLQHKLEDREKAEKDSDAHKLKDQDRAGKTVEEKRDINSDGPRSDAGEDTPLETQKPVPEK